MSKCYYCPEDYPTMWVFRNHIDAHHKAGDHNRPCPCGKPLHVGSWECPDDGRTLEGEGRLAKAAG